MTNIQHITHAVNNEFKFISDKNIVKAYLIKWLLLNPETCEAYNNKDISNMLGITPQKVGEYLGGMVKSKGKRRNIFLKDDFEQKLDNVILACSTHVKVKQVTTHQKSIEVSLNRTGATLKRIKQQFNK